MRLSKSAVALCLALTTATNLRQGVGAFVPATVALSSRPGPAPPAARAVLLSSPSSSTGHSASAASEVEQQQEEDPLGLTTELRKITDAFQKIGDVKLRYKQLLYMAQNGLEPMPEELKVDENKVLGCLSTVHVHATPTREGDKTLIHFQGDSDGLLTKGLVALLIRGLSGNTADAIQKVDPNFIQTAGISQSLTPGRNNGFLNMLALMKKKATEIANTEPAATTSSTAAADDKDTAAAATNGEDGGTADLSLEEDRPMYNAIMTKLSTLKPTHIKLVDNSRGHAGDVGNPVDGESHFQLEIVADAFDGLNLVKRHQLIYMMLGDVMPQIHALQIQAQTPEEAAAK